MKQYLTWMLIVTFYFLTGCTEPDTDADSAVYIDTFPAGEQRKSPADLTDATTENLIQPHLDFAFSEFRIHTPSLENTLTAPFDLQQSLAMLSVGADGATLDAFVSAAQIDINDMVSYDDISLWEQQVSALTSVERSSILWGQLSYRFSHGYLQQQAELFGPEMIGLDFLRNAESSKSSIVERLDFDPVKFDLSSRTRLFSAQLSNVSVSWSDQLTTELFTGRFGAHEEQHQVEMVRVEGLLRVAETADYKAVEIPLSDPGLALVMITPTAGRFETVRVAFNSDSWKELQTKLIAVNTSVAVPEFILQRELPGNSVPDLGIALSDGEPVIIDNGSSYIVGAGTEPDINVDTALANTPTNPELAANFSSINNAGYLYLDSLKQHMLLAVSVQGINANTTTAAAHLATVYEPHYLFDFDSGYSAGFTSIWTIEKNLKSCYKPADQSPFIFAIYARESGTLLYLGQLMSLEGQVVDPDWTVPTYSSCGNTAPVEIFQYKGSLQCEINSGVPYWEMEQELFAVGIEVLASAEADDGLAHIQVCGSSDGVINVFSIRENQLAAAQALGFRLKFELAQ